MDRICMHFTAIICSSFVCLSLVNAGKTDPKFIEDVKKSVEKARVEGDRHELIKILANKFTCLLMKLFGFNSESSTFSTMCGISHTPETSSAKNITQGSCGRPAIAPDESGKESNRIVGGTEAIPHSFPWLVQVLVSFGGKYKKLICGGSIVSAKTIVSAAHCLYIEPVNNYFVKVGAHLTEGGEEPYEKIVTVEGFESYDKDVPMPHDIGVIYLVETLEFNEHISPICLPTSKAQYHEQVVVAGWGQIYEGGPFAEKLQQLWTVILDMDKECSVYESDNKIFICAGQIEGGKDSCRGDSGGPLAGKQSDEYVLYGVVSFGEGCARPNSPGIYTNVTYYVNWLNSKIIG